MRCYPTLTFASVAVAAFSAPDIASPRSNEAPSLVRRAEMAYASPYTYIGCYTDSFSNRALSVGNPASETLVIESCAATCAESNYTYMGVEYGEECYCDNTINPASSPTAETDCNTPCGGDPNEICGGSLAIAVYEVGGTPDSAALSAESASYSYGYGPTATNNIPPRTWTPTPPLNTTGQRLKCPDDQGAIYSFNGTTFEVECNKTISGFRVSSGGNNRPGGYDPTMDLQGCLQACTFVPNCVAAVFYQNFCYYKSADYAKANPSALGEQDGAESGIIPLGNVVCPAWDGNIYKYNNVSYQIQCNLDHPGYDINSTTANPGGIIVQDLQSCLQACYYVPGCVAATWVESQQMYYYKNSQWPEGTKKVQNYTCDSGVPPRALLVSSSSSSSSASTLSSTSSISPGSGSGGSASSTNSATDTTNSASSTSSDTATTSSASPTNSASGSGDSTTSTSSSTASATTAPSTYTFGGQTYNVYFSKYKMPTTTIGSSSSGSNPDHPASNDQVNGITVTDLASCVQACSTMSNCNSATWVPSNGQCLYSSDVPSAGPSTYEVDTAIVSTKDPNATGMNEGIASPGAYSQDTTTTTSTSATSTDTVTSSPSTSTSSGLTSPTTSAVTTSETTSSSPTTSGSSSSSMNGGDAPTTTSSSSVIPTTSATTGSSSASGSGSSSQLTTTSSSATTSSTSTSPNVPPALLSMSLGDSTTSSSMSSSPATSTDQAYYHNLQAGAYAPLVVAAKMSSSSSLSTPSPMIYRYLGCYSSTNSTPFFMSPHTIDDSVTTESCVAQCAAGSYDISGVLAGNACGCNAKLSDTVPPNGRVDESNCTLVCPGNSTEVCGGSGNGLIGTTKYVSLYSASPSDCLFGNVTSAGVSCTPYYYLGPGGGQSGTSSNVSASGSGTSTGQSPAGSTSSSYSTTAYALPPSSVYTAPLSSNTNGYSPAFGAGENNGGSGGANSGAGGANSVGGAGIPNTEVGQCPAPRTIVVTTDKTVTVSAPSTAADGIGTMNGIGNTLSTLPPPTAKPSYNTMEYIFRPSSMYGASNPAMSGVGYSPAVGTMSQ